VPELPEVEAVRRQLRRVMVGVRIARVIARRPDLRIPFPPDFAARLEGRTVRALTRRAKYLVAELSSGEALLMHLGMSGSFRVQRDGREGTPGDFHHARNGAALHDHVLFEMSSGATIVFNDPRRFGSMRLVGADDPALRALGPEPLGRAFTAAVLAQALKGRKTSLKAALSDQRVVAGLGNIYVCEALNRARLSPTRRASTLATRSGAPRKEAQALAEAIKAVLTEAIDRQTGRRRSSRERFRVYDREGERCRRLGCPGRIRRIVQAGRSTFFCPVCQR
jgi:formamidopyrimidine-DNA glycosylase